jgi:hypothetical protein
MEQLHLYVLQTSRLQSNRRITRARETTIADFGHGRKVNIHEGEDNLYLRECKLTPSWFGVPPSGGSGEIHDLPRKHGTPNPDIRFAKDSVWLHPDCGAAFRRRHPVSGVWDSTGRRHILHELALV